MTGTRAIRVLVVDDSAFVRSVLSKGLQADSGVEVVGTAADAYEARDKIVQLKPDVLTLDIEMPKMDGLEFLRRLMPQYPLPIIVISSLTRKGTDTAIMALELGAVDVVAKPQGHFGYGLHTMMSELLTRVKIASTANVSHWKNRRHEVERRQPTSRRLRATTDKVIAIGASTGGTEALKRVLTGLPGDTPGVVVVQHMPPGFTRQFADHLNQICTMTVKEAETGDRILPGRVLIAPGSVQMKVKRSGGIYEVICAGADRVSGHCPSADVMMLSVAEHVGANAVGVILTGMGRDGAEGMLAMRRAGARTVAQNKETCVVFGMPKVAYENGGVERLVAIDDIADDVLNMISGNAGFEARA